MAQSIDDISSQFDKELLLYLTRNPGKYPTLKEAETLKNFILANFHRHKNSYWVVISQSQMITNNTIMSQAYVDDIFAKYWDFIVRDQFAEKGITTYEFIKYYVKNVAIGDWDHAYAPILKQLHENRIN